ncbi:hypothetical protein P4B35_21430 [Pontiellaceae bacterium B12227]|nr:hypothetical protein [Pontiellaceae bacterium B12227]
MNRSGDSLYPAESELAGWGRKKSGRRAIKVAGERCEDFCLYEDGFLRSIDREDVALSIVRDKLGIYYDATTSSQLERMIFQTLEVDERERAEKLIDQWRGCRLSKYNSAQEYSCSLPERYVLVVDQVAGDLSIEYGLANPSSFENMLSSALSENPECMILLKVHPDFFTRNKGGHFDFQTLEKNKRIKVIAENCHPVRLIQKAETVYCVTSQVGFEALIWGKQVRCFGMPFYAGWGLTKDELPLPDRRKSVALEQLVHAALIKYPRYFDPEQNEECAAEKIIEYIGLQRQMRSRFPGTLYVYGFSQWKQPFVELFFQGSELFFLKNLEEVPSGATLIVWGSTEPKDIKGPVEILRVEDGFLRSSGLGGDLIRPMSWVVDDLGMYYDASRPSRLEQIFQTLELNPELEKRAVALRTSLVETGIGKYNLGGSGWVRPEGKGLVILVPGQVENDASIRYGAPKDSSNSELLRTVREMYPDAYLVYKPHPDVVAGLRRKGSTEIEMEQWCDEIILSGDVLSLFSQVDTVHTLTSLTGFEALLRGVPVTCHGNPFYAGWGLTTDLHPMKRRTRKLSLDELVAGALILYPTYISRITDRFTTPEQVVNELQAWRESGPGRMPIWRRGLRQVLRIWAFSGLRRNA